jgi:hypothetical protein
VASVDNKVTEVVGGVQTIFSQPGKSLTWSHQEKPE